MNRTLALTTPTAPTDARRQCATWRWRRVVRAVRKGDRVNSDVSQMEAGAAGRHVAEFTWNRMHPV